MNTKKHKHKNRPKPTTGSSGSAEVKGERSEVIENREKIETPSDIDKPEEKKPVEAAKVEKIQTIENLLQDQAIEVKETTDLAESKNESEPAKPKRNKNKKKKQDPEKPTQEIIEPEKLEAITEQVLSEPSQIEESIPIIEKEKIEAETEVDAAITPSARKKKNKKKSQEKPAEAIPVKEIKPQDISLPDKIEQLDAEVTELFSSTPEPIQEVKGKKKNKKKNRNDSEKSDKSEDIKCTAAFEKLLVEETQLQETEIIETEVKEVKNKDKASKDVSPVIKEEIIQETTLDEVTETPKDHEVTETSKDHEVTESPKDQSKSKKKNKKDKKHTQVETGLEQAENIPELIPIPSAAQETLILTETKIVREFSPKPKAKIAKPVEKKSKENKEVTKPVENISGDSENLNIIPEIIETTSTIPKEDVKEKESKSIIEPEQRDTKTPDEISKFTSKEENLNIPVASTMGKKRKKSPKLPKCEPPKETESISTNKPEPTQSKPEDVKESDLATEPEPVKQIQESTIETDDKTTKTTEVKALTDDVPTVLPKFDDKTAEGKSGKKKKKTPKFPTQSEIHEEKVEILATSKDKTEPIPTETSVSDDSVKKDLKEKEIELKPVSLEDIEVRSVRTDESEGSTCNVTPDIYFERSSSQQIFDDNNNTTVIQELISVDNVKFTDTLPIPIIEGSGETPLPTPEVLESISLTKSDEKNQGKDETIKSKMMEVNKDMEELRMSIERSLAEFSAMEKTEQESEKLFEEKRKIETEGTKPKQEQVKIEKESNIPNIKNETSSKEMKVPEHIPSETQESKCSDTPLCPARKDKKGKGKKGKGKLDTPVATTASTQSSSTTVESSDKTKEEKKEKQEKDEKKSQSTEQKGKQKSHSTDFDNDTESKEASEETNLTRPETVFSDSLEQLDYDKIDNFEDALTSSNDDVNKTFELIAQEAETDNEKSQKELSANKPEINVTDADEDTKTKRNEKVNPVSPPKNLLGPNDIPVPSNKMDYKKEKNKPPNERQAKVKIKDATDIEKKSKESQTESRIKSLEKSVKDTYSHVVKDNDEYVYKYSFRKVFLQSACHVCKKDLGQVRVPCGYCNLVFYCGTKHKDEDYSQHQALCFAVSTIVHLKDQKHIYADAKGITGQDYRILRMQMILSCEKVLKRRLVPWEQEAMLYPRICADVTCREWRQAKLKDCAGCGQISYCTSDPSHLPKSHQRWCKSYSLYAKLVTYQQTKGRLEPRLPTKVLQKYEVPAKMNEVLAAMYEEKIDMNDIQYAALTQLATAPLTAAYYHQLYRNKKNQIYYTNGNYKKPLVIHVVGAELQFEADALNKWEVFFLHLRPDVHDMTVVLISPALNPGNLPLDLLGKVRVCSNCKENNRRVNFSFQDMPYYEYRISDVFINPDLICAFNPSIQRSSSYNMKDDWSSTITSILKLQTPFIITAYTLPELRKDIAKIKELSEIDFSIIAEPILNNFASVRPDRNFITDDELPLLFKNYCVSVICGC